MIIYINCINFLWADTCNALLECLMVFGKIKDQISVSEIFFFLVLAVVPNKPSKMKDGEIGSAIKGKRI